jgi:hypothetical protein
MWSRSSLLCTSNWCVRACAQVMCQQPAPKCLYSGSLYCQVTCEQRDIKCCKLTQLQITRLSTNLAIFSNLITINSIIIFTLSYKLHLESII